MKAVELPDDSAGMVIEEYTARSGGHSQHRYVVKRRDGSELDIAADRTTETSVDNVL